MKTTITALLMLLILSPAPEQRPAPDYISTNEGLLAIQPLNHGTLALRWRNRIVYVDPYGGAKTFEGIDAPNIILITDIHGDHFNPETLAAINTEKAKLIVPQAVADKLPEDLKSKAIVLNNGEYNAYMDILVRAVPMYNLPESPDSRHPKGRGNGYLISFADRIVYVSGDTSGIPEMRELKNIDVAFVCMNIPYTMDINEAAEAVLAFKPKIVYPYHYRGQGGLSDTEAFKKLVTDKGTNIDVRLRNWYPQ